MAAASPYSTGTTTLSGAHVQKSTMLDYAATIHRTQCMMCDTSHAMFSSELTRSRAYTAAPLGRESNHLYGALQERERLDGLLDSVAAKHDTKLAAHAPSTSHRSSSAVTNPCSPAGSIPWKSQESRFSCPDDRWAAGATIVAPSVARAGTSDAGTSWSGRC